MEWALSRLSETFRKQEDPACACCGYDAEAIIRVGSFSRMFCEKCMVDALLDAMNFNTCIPDVAPAA